MKKSGVYKVKLDDLLSLAPAYAGAALPQMTEQIGVSYIKKPVGAEVGSKSTAIRN